MRLIRFFLVAAVFFAVSMNAVCAGECKIENAIYRMRARPGTALSFKKFNDPPARGGGRLWITDIAVMLSTEKNKRMWFLFDGGSSPYINMISTAEVEDPKWTPPPPEEGEHPTGNMTYYALTENLDFDDRLPSSGNAAPRYIFIPDLYSMLKGLQNSELTPLSLFDLVGCKK